MNVSDTPQTEPAVEPVTLAEMKLHLRVTHDDENGLIASWIAAARRWAERFTGRALVNQTWDGYLDTFADPILLPKPPLVSVTHVKYTDTAGSSQTVTNTEYTVDTNSTPGRIHLGYQKTWPNHRTIPDAVTVRWICGYGAKASDVPDTFKQAIRLLVGHWYEHHEDTTVGGGPPIRIPMGAKDILWSERIMREV